MRMSREQALREIERLADELLAEEPGLSRPQAIAHVVRARPDLGEAYTAGRALDREPSVVAVHGRGAPAPPRWAPAVEKRLDGLQRQLRAVGTPQAQALAAIEGDAEELMRTEPQLSRPQAVARAAAARPDLCRAVYGHGRLPADTAAVAPPRAAAPAAPTNPALASTAPATAPPPSAGRRPGPWYRWVPAEGAWRGGWLYVPPSTEEIALLDTNQEPARVLRLADAMRRKDAARAAGTAASRELARLGAEGFIA